MEYLYLYLFNYLPENLEEKLDFTVTNELGYTVLGTAIIFSYEGDRVLYGGD